MREEQAVGPGFFQPREQKPKKGFISSLLLGKKGHTKKSESGSFKRCKSYSEEISAGLWEKFLRATLW